MKKPNEVGIEIRGSSPGFAVVIETPGSDNFAIECPNWESALHTAEHLEAIVKRIMRDTSLKLAPLPRCSSCKSESVWHKSLDGNWTRFCMECDFVEHNPR